MVSTIKETVGKYGTRFGKGTKKRGGGHGGKRESRSSRNMVSEGGAHRRHAPLAQTWVWVRVSCVRGGAEPGE